MLAVGQPVEKVANKQEYARAATRSGDSGGGLLCVHEDVEYVFGVCMGSTDNNSQWYNYAGVPTLPSAYTNVYYHLAWIWSEIERQVPPRINSNNLILRTIEVTTLL